MISFTVEGIPIPQGSLRAFVLKLCRTCGGGNRAVLTSDNPRLKQWRKTVRAEALRAIGFEHPAGKHIPLRIEALFYLPRAKSNKMIDAVKKPDLDKLTRAALDSMTGVLFDDDSQIVEIHAFKSYGKPRAEFHVEEVGLLAVPIQHMPVSDSALPFSTT